MALRHPASLMTAALASLALALTACSSAATPSPQGSASGSVPTGVTLTYWHSAADPQAEVDMVNTWAKATGNTVTMVDLPNDTYTTAIQTKWATGERPDLLQYNPSSQDMAQLNVTENMQDLSSLSFVKAEGSLATSSGTVNGVTYAAVLGPLQAFGMYYNKSVFTSLGISVPKNATEIMEACTKIKAAGKVAPIFEAGGSEFPTMMLPGFTYMADANVDDAFSLGVKNGTTKVNQSGSPLVAGLTLYANLRDAGCFNSDAKTAQYTAGVKAVYNGSAAMMFLPSDMIQDFYAAANKDTAKADAAVGFAAWSADTGRASYAPGQTGTFFAPKTGDATKEAAAKAFIDWATTTGYQSYVDAANIIPTLSGAKTPAFTGLKADMATMLSGEKSIAFNTSIPGFGNFGKIAMKVLAGQDTPQQAADEFQNFIDQAIAAQ